MIDRRRFLAATATAITAASAPPDKVELTAVPVRPVSRGPKHHFFGYYDKCPWDATGRYLLAHEMPFADRQPKPGEAVALGRIDLADGDRFEPFDESLAWCWQTGAMLQWRPGTADREVIYNAIVDDKAVTVVRDMNTGEKRTLPLPVHFVHPNGREALTLDYDRLHRLRPGYGYVHLKETFADQLAPDSRGIYQLNLDTGGHRLVISLAQLAAFQPDERFHKAEHFVNHLQHSPTGAKFLFLHRWSKPGTNKWNTRMFVARPGGTELRLIADHGMVSHFDWRDDDTILAWAKHPSHGDKFYTYDLKRDAVEVFGAGTLTRDGHCSYSPDRKWVLNDTYPDADRLQTLMLIRLADGRRFDVGRFLSPRQYTGPVRCDLHPRFNRDGRQVCIDSTHDGKRQIYVADVSDVVKS